MLLFFRDKLLLFFRDRLYILNSLGSQKLGVQLQIQFDLLQFFYKRKRVSLPHSINMTFFFSFLHGIRVKLIGYSLSFSSHSFQFYSSSLFIFIAISLPCPEISESTPSITIGSNSSKLPISNSHSHSIQITTDRLNENSFLKWSQSVWMYIRGRGKIGYLTSDTKEPTKTNPSYATWDA